MNNATPVRRLQGAFTLIELLTVIAIIGILAAIIIPTVGKVRETARSAITTSNLREIQTASLAFANDNRGRYVPIRVGVFLGAWGGSTEGSPSYPNALNRWITHPEFLSYFGVSGNEMTTYASEPPSIQPRNYVPAAVSGSRVSILNGSVVFTDGRNTIGINKTDLTFSNPASGPHLGGRAAVGQPLKLGFTQSEVGDRASRLIAFAEASDWMVAHTFGGVTKWDKWESAYDGGASNPHVDAPAFRAGGKLLAITYAGGVVRLSREEASEWDRWSLR